MPERSIGPDCKSGGNAFVGSNPTASNDRILGASGETCPVVGATPTRSTLYLPIFAHRPVRHSQRKMAKHPKTPKSLLNH